MSIADKIKQSFPKGVHFPNELGLMSDWIEQNGYESIRYDIRLTEGSDEIEQYFDNGNKIKDSFGIFGHSTDGGLYAIWLKSKKEQPVIFLGSEGSEWYVLGTDFLSFLSLISCGFTNPFKDWVTDEFNIYVDTKKKAIDKKDRSLTRWIYEKLEVKIPFEEFDPDSKHNATSNSIDYKVIITSVPHNKVDFIKSIRILSKLSMGDLLRNFQNLPLTVYESHVFFRGKLDIVNFPEPDRNYLLELTTKYPDNIQIEYREYLGKDGKTDFKRLQTEPDPEI